MCGDSTDEKQIKEFCPKANLLLTDPPYGISIVGKDGKIGGGNDKIKPRKYLAVKGDETTDTAREAIKVAQGISDQMIIFGGNYFTDFLPPKACWIVWDKRNGSTTFADCELAWTSFDSAVRKYEWVWSGMVRAGSHEEEGKERIHPTQKPAGLIADILEDYSEEGDAVLDLFGGSGSTLIACEKTGRKCFMVEHEPAYVDLIVKRWEEYTGNKAERITPATCA